MHAPSVHFLLNVACTKMLSCVSIVFHIPPSCCPGTEVFSKARPFRKGKQFQHLFLSSITQIVVMGPTPPLAINIISYALQSGGGSRIIYVPISIWWCTSPLDNTNIIVHSLWRATTAQSCYFLPSTFGRVLSHITLLYVVYANGYCPNVQAELDWMVFSLIALSKLKWSKCMEWTENK